MFNSCDVLPVSFNSLEYAAVLVACKGAICVSSIQLSKVVVAGYLVDSHHKTMMDKYWSLQLNENQQLLKLDVKVITQKIVINTNDLWSPKN